MLEHRTLALQEASLDQQLSDSLEALHKEGHISSQFWNECMDDTAIARQLLIEEKGDAQEATRHIHAVARAIRAYGDCTSEEAQYLMKEMQRESDQHRSGAIMLDQDATTLAKDIKCVAVSDPLAYPCVKRIVCHRRLCIRSAAATALQVQHSEADHHSKRLARMVARSNQQ